MTVNEILINILLKQYNKTLLIIKNKKFCHIV